MLSGVNENLATTVIEGALAMAGDLVDLDVVRGMAAESGADVLPVGHNVQRAARAVSKKWWRSFGYDYVLAAIRANHFDLVIRILLLLSLGYTEGKGGGRGCTHQNCSWCSP
jgi:hypothetical protein